MSELRTQIRDTQGLIGALHYEQRMVLRDDLADIPPLGEFERKRLSDRISAAIDTQTVEGFLGCAVPKCVCGSALIQGARFCIDCGAQVVQSGSGSASTFAATGPTQRLGE